MKTLVMSLFAFLAMASASQAAELVGQAKAISGGAEITILTNTFQQAAYVFDPDQVGSGKSACNGKCAEVWPPLTISDQEAIALRRDEKQSETLSTIKRESGLNQLTYLGRPIYLFNLDRAIGDVKGDGIGGVWHLVRIE